MSDELREQIARRLYGCAGGQGWEGVDALNRTPYLLLASECIRLMEWARIETYNDPAGWQSAIRGLPTDSWRPNDRV